MVPNSPKSSTANKNISKKKKKKKKAGAGVSGLPPVKTVSTKASEYLTWDTGAGVSTADREPDFEEELRRLLELKKK